MVVESAKGVCGMMGKLRVNGTKKICFLA